MPLTPVQTLIMILAVALGTVITRFTPFVLFPDSKEPPKIIHDLGKMLPSAMMGLLVIYCLKDVSFLSSPFGVPELIAVAVTAALHILLGKTLLSIGAGTALYMALVQFVFV